MKHILSLFLLIPLLTNAACSTPPTAAMTLKIVDSTTQKPILNAVVGARFRYDYNDAPTKEVFYSNTNGICLVKGPIRNYDLASDIVKKGYYKGWAQLDFKGRNQILNRWKPWNPTIEVKLRPIKKPVPMVHKKIFRLPPPKTNSSVGFDLMVGDWVAPCGKGKVSDFVFTVTLVLTPKKGAQYKLTFANPNDGIQEYESSKEIHSYFKWPYLAPLSKYKTSLERFAYYMFPNPRIPSTNLKKNVNYIFRVRSKVDKKGNLISAYYGYIKGEIQIEKENAFYFEYWLNTNSTSRSLEWIGNVPHDQQKNYK